MAGTNDWYLPIDRLIFIDLKKAFDTVNHDILLKKLEKYRISGLEVVYFLLAGKKAVLQGKFHLLQDKRHKFGCPPGALSWPTSVPYVHILMFINDLPFCLKKGKVTMYAYETSISHSLRCLSKLQDDLNQDLVN